MTLLRIISVVVVAAAVVVVVTCLHQHDSNVSKDVYSDKRIILFSPSCVNYFLMCLAGLRFLNGVNQCFSNNIGVNDH